MVVRDLKCNFVIFTDFSNFELFYAGDIFYVKYF
jgi:hypothetical protein